MMKKLILQVITLLTLLSSYSFASETFNQFIPPNIGLARAADSVYPQVGTSQELADDFFIFSGGSVTNISWIGSDYSSTNGFRIRIYPDNSGWPGSNPIYDFNTGFIAPTTYSTPDFGAGNIFYEYNPTGINLLPSTKYWLSIQEVVETASGYPWAWRVIHSAGNGANNGAFFRQANGNWSSLSTDNYLFSITTNPSPNINSGSVTINNSTWTTVSLSHQYQSMVVVATPEYTIASPPSSVRIRNASNNQFEVMLQRLDGQTAPISENVRFIAIEEGVYDTTTHGVTMEAVKFTSTVTDENNSWVGEARSYQNTYTNPVVLGQVMTANDPNFSEFWSRGASQTAIPDGSNLYVGKHVAEDPTTSRADETIGYIVIESGSGTVGGLNYVAGVGADSIEGIGNGTYQYLTGQSGTVSGVAACLTAMDGNNGGWAVLSATPLVDTLTLSIDEDQLNDSERNHITEQVAYWILY